MLTAMPDTARPIVFVSDFGFGNEWVGFCHAVMAGIAPESPIVDLSHGIRRLEVGSGALLLADAMPWIPENAVVLAVVDPNVGKDREVAVETKSGRLLVGPDNGLLALAWKAAGGVAAAAEITSPDVIRPPRAQSFRAPDTLCRATAHLATGLPLAELGPAIDAGTLEVLSIPEPEVQRGKICSEIIDFNRFGNLQLNVREAHLIEAELDDAPLLRIEAISGYADAGRGTTFADFEPNAYGLIFDAGGWLTIVRGNPGNALQGLGVTPGDLVWISAAAGESAPA
jgi:S-adenosyl-L-methionine hydrolase (adenosine-forming)